MILRVLSLGITVRGATKKDPACFDIKRVGPYLEVQGTRSYISKLGWYPSSAYDLQNILKSTSISVILSLGINLHSTITRPFQRTPSEQTSTIRPSLILNFKFLAKVAPPSNPQTESSSPNTASPPSASLLAPDRPLDLRSLILSRQVQPTLFLSWLRNSAVSR